MKTLMSKSKIIKSNWYIINAEKKILGRLATKVSHYLRGKHKIEYTPHINLGDYVIVLNANKIIVTGNKLTDKIYYNHSGYVGNIKKVSFKEMLNKNPKNIIKLAVKGMLPKGTLGRSMLKKLRIYSGNQHNHLAQKPYFLDI